MAEKIYDVIVAGGGPAGSVAAISAARNGASVLMVEKLGFPGGMATAGMVNPIHTYHNMRKEQIVGGVPDEIVKRLWPSAGPSRRVTCTVPTRARTRIPPSTWRV
jgi:flavin-dependent dehydrogenase